MPALMLFDGRNLAQNGWFIVRSLLPAGKTGKSAYLVPGAQCYSQLETGAHDRFFPGGLPTRTGKNGCS